MIGRGSQFGKARGKGGGVRGRFHIAVGGGSGLCRRSGRGGAVARQLRKAARGLVHAQFAQAGKAAAKAVKAPRVQIEGHGLSLIHICTAAPEAFSAKVA